MSPLNTAIVLAQVWSANGISSEMYPIAHLESSFGERLDHRQSALGPDWTAVGALGIKPITAFESLKRNGYDGSQEDVTARLKQDQSFYNYSCRLHWDFLRNSFPDLKRAVYAWRWGFTAALKATEWKVAFDMYVLRYFEIAASNTKSRKNVQ